VTVDFLPHGAESQKQTLGTIEIINTGQGDVSTGHYRVIRKDAKGATEQRTSVAGHQRADGWLVLVGKALERLLEKRS
jgi:hypothetical protein